MALGAEPGRVRWMVMGEVALLIGLGLTVGLGAALATTRIVATFLYGLTPNDPLTLAPAVALLAGVASFAGYLQARRASRLEPLTALREV
jgi:putative ABC transport system permease protein